MTSPVINWMESSEEQPPWSEVEQHSPEVQDLWSQWHTLEIVEGCLYRQYQRPDGTVRYRQIVAPRKLRVPLLVEVHGGVTSGHFGSVKTQERLKRYAYWQGWKTDVDLFVRRCDTCEEPTRSLAACSSWTSYAENAHRPHRTSRTVKKRLCLSVDSDLYVPKVFDCSAIAG